MGIKRIILTSDETLNDSDKTVSLTSGQIWEVLSIRVEYTATATVGTRTLAIAFRDSEDDVYLGLTVSNNSITASQVMVFNFYQDAPTVAPTDGAVEGSQALPPIFLPPGGDIRVYDSAAIAAAADDMQVHVLVARHD